MKANSPSDIDIVMNDLSVFNRVEIQGKSLPVFLLSDLDVRV